MSDGGKASASAGADDWVDGLTYGPDGLIPVVVQDASSLEVLMMAYANDEAVRLTLQTGQAWFYSRSRRRLWRKGETSGNHQRVEWVRMDCDRDALLVGVTPAGPACHTGSNTCFFRTCWQRTGTATAPDAPDRSGARPQPAAGEPARAGSVEHLAVLDELWAVICSRRDTLPEGSYTASLFRGSLDSALKKVTEEAGEFILACKAGDVTHSAAECADLWFHSMVALARCGAGLEQVLDELTRRRSGSPHQNRP